MSSFCGHKLLCLPFAGALLKVLLSYTTADSLKIIENVFPSKIFILNKSVNNDEIRVLDIFA